MQIIVPSNASLTTPGWASWLRRCQQRASVRTLFGHECLRRALAQRPRSLDGMLRMIRELLARGIAVGHQYANYTVAALHDVGLGSVTHHLGWVDKGEPAAHGASRCAHANIRTRGAAQCEIPRGGSTRPRNSTPICTRSATAAARSALDVPSWAAPISAAARNTDGRNEERTKATDSDVAVRRGQHVALLAQSRTEVEAFSTHSAVQVIEKDIDRASALNRGNDVARLGQLAAELKSA